MASQYYLRYLALSAFIVSVTSFSTSLPKYSISSYVRPSIITKNCQSDDDTPSSYRTDRRSFLTDSTKPAAALATATGLSLIFTTSPSLAADKTTLPICVIGSNGRTGTACVQACLDRSIPVRATSRSGTFDAVPTDASTPLLTKMICDVTDPTTVASAIEGSRAVIFAASASKQGGAPAAVDNAGLVNVARACLAADGVSHLVIVSSGAVTKPDSPVYKFLNLFGGIMAEKIKGEDAVRALYRGKDGGDVFTVVRPGGLTEEPGRGVAALELNQGDTKSGRISRVDVAALCVESILNPQYTGDTTFECYDADTGKPLQSVGISNIMKAKTEDNKAFLTGRECQGDSWEKIFSGLERDA